MAKDLNKVLLIGNLTRDPEMRATPAGAMVASFGLATNRVWTNAEGEKTEDTQYHKISAWGKVAELCEKMLTKGSRVYIEGRIENRSWTAPDGQVKSNNEIVINDMILLDRKE